MRNLKYALLGILVIGCGTPQALLSKMVTLINSSGEEVHLEVGSSDQFLDVLDRIQMYYDRYDSGLQAAQESRGQDLADAGLAFDARFDLEVSHAGITVRSKKPVKRNFSNPVTKQQKKDIALIITTLGYDSLISIGSSKSSLQKAGDRIEHIHPFRFLMTIFADEKLKAGVHAIRGRIGWISDGFFDGITGSLKEEAARDNLLQFVPEFAGQVNIEPSLILPSLEKGKWTEFVNILIDKIPRAIDPNRYDM